MAVEAVNANLSPHSAARPTTTPPVRGDKSPLATLGCAYSTLKKAKTWVGESAAGR
jgi:hypothetical protein